MERRPITVTLEKQATLQALEKGKPALELALRRIWHYWNDPIDLVTRILNASTLNFKMHFGMAQYVDFPSEIRHSRSWGSSVLTTSGEYARTADGDIILLGDIVRFASTVQGFWNSMANFPYS
ncbi:hypothetical protein NA56DRAFT_657331 [Hyaloscypha hepaticicola]|uniref:Uncharacterized protein n=1 Tax=Hyaloscypha hepaticicola TaxID=2082293 RepID=A0A2J6QAH9_9HELO|nr:hypothetical protein NA56DRAFT_657331 [Hyaloscypha hepaticicola]